MRPEDRTVEQILDDIASQAYGIVTRQEMLAAEISEGAIKRRVRSGLLIPQYRGVYRVGHCAPSMEAGYMGAVKACGDDALLCCRPAAYLFGLVKRGPAPPEVATTTERKIDGIRTRRDRRQDVRDGTVYRRIPVTTVARTLVDLAAVATLRELTRAFHEAGVLHGTTPRQVNAILLRRPTSPGAGKVRAIMLGDSPVTLSRLEQAFLKLLRDARLPLPVMNRVAGGRRVDCRWPEYGLTVELDSYQFHNSRYAWEQDRTREREARARDDEFRRYTWADIENPRLMLAELRRLLAVKRPA